MEWQLIATADEMKTPDTLGLTPNVILGFAPDETGETLPSGQGHWSPKKWMDREPCWVSSLDGDVPFVPAQPTHWMPLPKPPKEGE